MQRVPPESGSVALRGTRTRVQGVGGHKTPIRHRWRGSGGQGRARALRRRAGLAPIGCGARTTWRRLAAARQDACHFCALDRLPWGATVPTCRGLFLARAGLAGLRLAAVCAPGGRKLTGGSPGTLACRPGDPLHPLTLARHPPRVLQPESPVTHPRTPRRLAFGCKRVGV